MDVLYIHININVFTSFKFRHIVLPGRKLNEEPMLGELAKQSKYENGNFFLRFIKCITNEKEMRSTKTANFLFAYLIISEQPSLVSKTVCVNVEKFLSNTINKNKQCDWWIFMWERGILPWEWRLHVSTTYGHVF